MLKVTHAAPALCAALVAVSPCALAGHPDAVLYRFHGGHDGYYPSTALVADAAGNLYGAAGYGGGTPCAFYNEPGCGILFELSPPPSGKGVWTETILYRFQGGADGAYPGPLLRGSDGTLYGLTGAGGDTAATCIAGQTGCGTVFALSPPSGSGTTWTLQTLYAFTGATDGGVPGSLIPGAAAGSLVGTTVAGGYPSCRCGVVFSLTPPAGNSGPWTEAVLYAFTGFPKHSNIGDGSEPLGVVFDRAGNLVGATAWGGHYIGGEGGSAYGTVFTLSPPASGSGPWAETNLDRFGADDANPVTAPVIDSAGHIFGTTYNYVYQIVSGTAVDIFDFNSNRNAGYLPYGGVTPDAAGNLFGTTIGGGATENGVVYRLRRAGAGEPWTETVLYNFKAGRDGSAPAGPVTLLGNMLTGTTLRGGTQGCLIDNGVGCGTVFSLQISRP